MRLVNVVRGLKLYEEVFMDIEMAKLNDFVSKLKSVGHNGELSGAQSHFKALSN
ncbi:hypothetical protein J1N35_038290 [Gossypium stocksii]|uniref:Uncharacterized protein n=1 Tax=Gossypium stocksii TaxID=47602 RepID=A0A9D3ZLQ7_9ROSI|nr:hypothetical protein J1N35_038290 [Gossypium stocksii]